MVPFTLCEGAICYVEIGSFDIDVDLAVAIKGSLIHTNLVCVQELHGVTLYIDRIVVKEFDIVRSIERTLRDGAQNRLLLSGQILYNSLVWEMEFWGEIQIEVASVNTRQL